jgi:hypothetical protein
MAKRIADFVAPAYVAHRDFPLLICLYTGQTLPRYVEPMSRVPKPPLGALLNETFPQSYGDALSLNSEVHDGAVLAGRTSNSSAYAVTGWSYRLYPPALQRGNIPNRGSAFQSCRAMSALPEVDAVLLFARNERMIFLDGELQDSAAVT